MCQLKFISKHKYVYMRKHYSLHSGFLSSGPPIDLLPICPEVLYLQYKILISLASNIYNPLLDRQCQS